MANRVFDIYTNYIILNDDLNKYILFNLFKNRSRHPNWANYREHNIILNENSSVPEAMKTKRFRTRINKHHIKQTRALVRF